MAEKKKMPIGRWILISFLTYLALVTYMITRLVDDMSYMWPYIILFVVCGIIFSPPLKEVSNGIKILGIACAGILVVGILLSIAPVTIGTAIGHFLSIFVMGYTLLYVFGFLVLALIVGFFMLIGYLLGPCCCCWYWWD